MDTTVETESVRLYYWPHIQGRGEFVRLVLEEAGVPYLDVARLPKAAGGGVARLVELRRGEGKGLLPYAPPFVKVGGLLVAQTAAICDFLGRRYGLVADDEAARAGALQLQMTIADVVAEAHDTHHPVSTSAYYEDQKDAAIEAAKAFVAHRLPQWLGYFEKVVERGGGDWLLGAQMSYVDLGLFQLVAGLRYAFPSAMEQQSAPRVFALADRVAEREQIAAYLRSERRIPFNEDGIFRAYPDLDVTG